MDDHQRGDKRVTINKEFESFDAFVHEYVTNVSRSGVFIRTKEPLPVGTEVELTFTVIMDDVETIEGLGVEATRLTILRQACQGIAAFARFHTELAAQIFPEPTDQVEELLFGTVPGEGGASRPQGGVGDA